MSFLGKIYTFVKQENFEGYLKSVGVSDNKLADAAKFAPDQKLVKDGDTYSYITICPEGPKERKFQSGVEIDDVIGFESTPIKSTYVVDGNTVTQTFYSSSIPSKTYFKREYNGDELVITVTSDKWDGVAKRFYKAQ